MPLIPNKKEFVQSVSVIIDADLGVENLLFPTIRLHTTEEITYDTATVEGVAGAYNSFANTANVIKKDGKDTVTIAPVNFNDSISKETIDADSTKFGQNEYGEGTVDATTQSALSGVGKLRLNHISGKKKLIYEALTTHQIADGYETVSGKQDIVFNVPAVNKVVFDDGAGKKYWSVAADATPLTNLATAYAAMKVKPSAVVMSDVTYSLFYDSAEVLTMDNNTTGLKKNFIVNEEIDANAMFFRAGRMMFKGVTLDVYVERQQAFDGSTYSPYLADGYVVLASPIGEINYGGIPVAESNGVRRIAAEWDAEEIISSNPPQHNLVVRTAPLPTLKNGEAYYSIKVIA